MYCKYIVKIKVCFPEKQYCVYVGLLILLLLMCVRVNPLYPMLSFVSIYIQFNHHHHFYLYSTFEQQGNLKGFRLSSTQSMLCICTITAVCCMS